MCKEALLGTKTYPKLSFFLHHLGVTVRRIKVVDQASAVTEKKLEHFDLHSPNESIVLT